LLGETSRRVEIKAVHHLFIFFLLFTHSVYAQVTLEWEKKEDASYVVEIAENKNFTPTLVRKELSQNYYVFSPGKIGVFFWRVKLKFPGVPDEVVATPVGTIEVDVKKIATIDSQTRFVSKKKMVPVKLQWTPNKFFSRYKVVIKKKNKVLRTDTISTNVHEINLPAGDYTWKVLLLDRAGKTLVETGWSKVKTVYIPPPPPPKPKKVAKAKPKLPPKPKVVLPPTPYKPELEYPKKGNFYAPGAGEVKKVFVKLKEADGTKEVKLNGKTIAKNPNESFTLNLYSRRKYKLELVDKFDRKMIKDLNVQKNRFFDFDCQYNANYVIIDQSTNQSIQQLVNKAEFSSTSADCHYKQYIRHRWITHVTMGGGAEYGFSGQAEDDGVALEDVQNLFGDIYIHYKVPQDLYYAGYKTNAFRFATGLEVMQYPFYLIEDNEITVSQRTAFYFSQQFIWEKKWHPYPVTQSTYMTTGFDLNSFSSGLFKLGMNFDIFLDALFLKNFSWNVGGEYNFKKMTLEEDGLDSTIHQFVAYGGMTWYY
jgi:hypothetical protein